MTPESIGGGSSFATDVSLREYFESLREADRELERERISHIREVARLKRDADQLAVAAAFAASKELLDKHNDLIRAMERKDETYASRIDLSRIASVQSKMLGGLIVLGAIGVGNLIRVWTG